MVLHVDSDAKYITMPEERSCHAGHFYLRDWPSPSPIKPNPEINRPTHTECKKIRNALSLGAEAETCVQPVLITLDHKQPATPLKTDNYKTEGFVNLCMKPKHSKIWDMKYHWLRDKEVLKQLRLYWYRRTNNDDEDFTKPHPPIDHCKMQPRYIHT